MDTTQPHLGPVILPRLERGQSARLRVGRLELVLEATRSGFSLLCLDGQQARTWTLGLPREGELRLGCRAPRWPLSVGLRDPLVLVPGGRVRGYVKVPLVPTLLWQREGGTALQVAELVPVELGAEWDEGSGSCILRCTSPLLARLPPPSGEPCAIVPWALRNDGTRVQSPETLPLQLVDRELRRCRGHLLATPRRLRFDDSGPVVTLVRQRWEAAVP
jgi:hypothetical protein